VVSVGYLWYNIQTWARIRFDMLVKFISDTETVTQFLKVMTQIDANSIKSPLSMSKEILSPIQRGTLVDAFHVSIRLTCTI